MSFLKSVFYLILLAGLTGCLSHSPPVAKMSLDEMADGLKLPRQVTVIQMNPVKYTEPNNDQYWQVVVQQEGDTLRWLRFDLLGAPDARQILQNSKWRNEGFIAPNPQARELFAALLFAWTKDIDLPQAYGKTHWRCHFYLAQSDTCMVGARELKENQRIRWTVHWLNRFKRDEFTIKTHRDGVVWKVQPIDKK